MDVPFTRQVTVDGYGELTYRLVGVVDMSLARGRLGPRDFNRLMKSHPRKAFAAARVVALGPGDWDPFEVWVPLTTDNLPGLPIAVTPRELKEWQQAWAPALRTVDPG